MGLNLKPFLPGEPVSKRVGRLLLGSTLMFAGSSHLTFARKPFRAQVPPWVPINPDLVVLLSGAAEITLGTSLVFCRGSASWLVW